tara:strand:+ start:14330 stop:14626 length:297 start_codon:yes stop_codon:yes gene_type:complete
MKWILFINEELALACDVGANGFGCIYEASASTLGFTDVVAMIDSWQVTDARVVSFEVSPERCAEIESNWQSPDYVIPEVEELRLAAEDASQDDSEPDA